jgi:hypothetical protein
LSGLTVTSATGHTMAGLTESTIEKLKLQEAKARPLLKAVQLMSDVVLSRNVVSDTGLQTVEVMGSAPPAATVYVAVPMGTPPAGGTIMFAGHVMVGGAASETETVNEHALTVLALSVAVHCTYVVPLGKRAPDVTLHPELARPESSKAVKLNATLALVPEVGWIVMDAGQVTAGGFSSVTDKRKVQAVETRLVLSVAVHITVVYV